MAQRFGEFIRDPEWPHQTGNPGSHFANLDIYEEEEANLSKEAEADRWQVKIQYQEAFLEEEEVFIKEEDSSNQEPEEKDSSFSQQPGRLQKLVKLKPDSNQQSSKTHTKPSRKAKQPQRTSIKPNLKRIQKRKKKTEYERGRYKILSEQVKKQIVEQAKSMTMVQVAKKYHVSVNNICRWRKRCDRRSGAGRKVTDMDMERKLLQWLNEQHNPIPRKQVQLTAKRMSRQDGFKASKGWFERFYKRNKLYYNTNIEILTHNDYRQRFQHAHSEPELEFELENECEHGPESRVKLENVKLEED